MKMDASVKRASLSVLALLLALLPVLCSCAAWTQHQAADAQGGAMLFAYRAYRRGDYVSALKNLSSAEQYELTDQRHAEILYLKGQCLEGMGSRLEAASQYEYVIKTYPDTQYAACASGRLEELRNQPQIPNRP